MKNYWIIQIQVVVDHELVGLGYISGSGPTFTSNKFESLRFDSVHLAKEWAQTNIGDKYNWLIVLSH